MYSILNRCFLFLFLTLFVFNGMAQDTTYQFIKLDYMPKVIWAHQVFKSNVKEAVSTHYEHTHDSLRYAGFAKWKFNAYGQMTDFSWQIIESDRHHGDSTTYRFNEEHLLEEVKWYNDLTDELYRTTRYTYLKNNRLKFIRVYDKKGQIRDSTVFNYVKDTLYPVEVLEYRTHSWVEDGRSIDSIELSARHRCRYDASNNLVIKYEYNGEGEFQCTQKWLYNKNNHCIKESIDVGDSPDLEWAYDVNQQGYILRTYEINKGRRDLSKENRYDGSKLIYQNTCRGKMLYSEEEWKYDAMGNKIFNSLKRPEVKIEETAYAYEYDKNGNFTRVLITVNKVPETLHERVIGYY